MNLNDILVQLGIGGGASVFTQWFKGDTWPKWFVSVIALGIGFASGFSTGGIEGAIMSALGAIGIHGTFLRGSRFGDALKLQMGSRIFSAIGETLKKLADAQRPAPPA